MANALDPTRFRFQRAPKPSVFPTEADVPESRDHLDLRTALYLFLSLAFGDRACLGSDQFVYWNPKDPRRCLAPDGLLKLGASNEPFPSWKTWERGVPDLCVEIVSESDVRRWDDKLEDYRELGAREVVRFDPRARPGARLEIWNFVDGDLVPRAVEGESAESAVLTGHTWVIAPLESHPAALRLRAPDGSFLQTPTEQRDAERAAHEAERAAAAKRIAELERELAERTTR